MKVCEDGVENGWNGRSIEAYLFVFLFVLIVVICFQCQFGAAGYTFEAARMKECEIFEWTDTINLIDDFVASQTRRFVEIWSIHHFRMASRVCATFSFHSKSQLTVFRSFKTATQMHSGR